MEYDYIDESGRQVAIVGWQKFDIRADRPGGRSKEHLTVDGILTLCRKPIPNEFNVADLSPHAGYGECKVCRRHRQGR